MRTRLEFQSMLEKILGSRNVYFDPPATIMMNYPAIIYSIDEFANRHANNSVYSQMIGYMITVIDKNPDSEIVKKIAKLPLSSFNRHYVSDNLHHNVFTLYY